MKPLTIFCVIVLSLINNIFADSCKGCVELNEISFNKVIKRFPASLVKFDVVYPFGEKHDIFEKFSKDVAASSDTLMATVGVKDYGDHENEALAKRYFLKKEEYPVLLLFKGDPFKPVKFTTEFTIENILKFVKENDVYFGLPGCIEEFDKLAAKFMTDKDSRLSILENIDELINLQNAELHSTANIYKMVMNKIIETGDDFVQNEVTRINKLLAVKLESKKRSHLSNKLNILQSFNNAEEIINTISKDEL